MQLQPLPPLPLQLPQLRLRPPELLAQGEETLAAAIHETRALHPPDSKCGVQ